MFWSYLNYTHFYVDEYQDIDASQVRLLKTLVKPDKFLFCAGEKSESIYQFRGADFAAIDRFVEDFGEVKKIVLKNNYRTKSQIQELRYEHAKILFEYMNKITLGNKKYYEFLINFQSHKMKYKRKLKEYSKQYYQKKTADKPKRESKLSDEQKAKKKEYNKRYQEKLKQKKLNYINII